MDIKKYIQSFFNKVANHSIEIYNEFSLQHELGFFLRNSIPTPYKVEFERNVKFFYPGQLCVKSEIDIVIYHPAHDERYAIELKYPKNGQHPESMFSFIKDIKFMEQVKELGFKGAYSVTYVEDKLFYQGPTKQGIYAFFREGKIINGEIRKPTGKKDEVHIINGHYQIDWSPLTNGSKYYLLAL
ncbi:hypothetical protein [Rossellomorea marisflavi]|uniref:hypothetical protein n=1 Tax=Rossellomorea marisflavi TaxID=189381 RepID=UPI00065D79F8|nr:hypothetical protein [Rossellomorea marisflavi]KML24095.1 hypothetical protein VL12_22250 [Rossellomorea marisflavi]